VLRLAGPFADVPFADWIGAAASIAVVFVVVVAIRYTARRILRKRLSSTAAGTLLLEVAARTHPILFVFPSVYVTAFQLDFTYRAWLRVGTEMSVIAQAAFWIAGVVHYSLLRFERERAADPNAAATLRVWRVSAIVFIWLFAVLIILGVAGVDVRTLITGLGIGGVAIALATQNILSELFASLSIMVDKPFVLGDTIQIGTDMGTVEHIGLRTTRVWALSGEQLIFSNSQLLRSTIRNMGRGLTRRVVSIVRVDYANSPAAVASVPALLRQAVESQQNVRFDRAHLANLGGLGFEFELVYFISSRDVITWMDAQQAVLLSIATSLRDGGISLASASASVAHERAVQG